MPQTIDLAAERRKAQEVRLHASRTAAGITDPVERARAAVQATLATAHQELVEDIETHRGELEHAIADLVARQPLTEDERGRLEAELGQYLTGYGPVQPLIDDPSVTEILVNAFDDVWFERDGRLHKASVSFPSRASYEAFAHRLAERAHKPLDETNPILNAELPDHARLNVTIYPVTDQPAINLRKAAQVTRSYDPAAFVATGAATEEFMQTYLWAVRSMANFLVCGPTGSGKTTLLRIGTEFGVPASQRIITAEDIHEVNAQHPHFLSMQKVDRTSVQISLTDLLHASLRKRPDRIYVGEILGDEAAAMLMAVAAGHNGLLATMHAGSPRQAMFLLVVRALLGGLALPPDYLLELLHSSLDFLVFVSRDFETGQRRVTSMVEVGESRSAEPFRTLFRWNGERLEHLQDPSAELINRLVQERGARPLGEVSA